MLGGALQWRHNGRDCVSNHQPHDSLLHHVFRRRSKKTSKLRVTGLCEGNPPETGEIPAQKANNAENAGSIWWRHHGFNLWFGTWQLVFDIPLGYGIGNCMIAPKPLTQCNLKYIYIYICVCVCVCVCVRACVCLCLHSDNKRVRKDIDKCIRQIHRKS